MALRDGESVEDGRCELALRQDATRCRATERAVVLVRGFHGGAGLSMPQSIPAGLTQEHVLRTLADLDAGIAIRSVNLPATNSSIKGSATPRRRSSGWPADTRSAASSGPKSSAAARLRGRRTSSCASSASPWPAGATKRPRRGETAQKDWTEQEVRLIVADYFDMLEAELLGKPFKKSEHRKALAPKLRGGPRGRSSSSTRTSAASWSNSACRTSRATSHGATTRASSPRRSRASWNRTAASSTVAAAPTLNPTQGQVVTTPDLDRIIEDPPDRTVAPTATNKPWLSRKGRRIDFAERDAANRHLGKLGEQFVLDVERYRLKAVGRDDLARRVVWASQDLGDGLGFDILSYDDADDSERMLEVKTTGLGKFFPFYVTSNEVRCSEDIPEQFQLFRVFDFGREPRLYILHGSLRTLCQLEPILFRAVF